MTQAPPAGNWQSDVQALWEQGQQQAAIDRLLERINAALPAIPRLLGLQLVYYIFQLGDLPGAERFLRQLLQVHPQDQEILENLAVVLSRQGKAAEAAPCFEQVVARSPGSVNAWDGLAASLSRLERYGEARAAGERSLALKTEAARPLPHWQPPAGTPQQHLERPGREQRRDLIAFSIWGTNPRYLRGALRNALLIPELYPGWQARFYLDVSVPGELGALLAHLGAECRLMPAGQNLRQKLCWRFQVANDPAVGRFLVRDCDSV
ncbi:MAG: tetratricopeptide repeat protein, partial [Prochlorococcaceae cyanobacterium]